MPLISLLSALYIGVGFYAGLHFILYTFHTRKTHLLHNQFLLFSLLCLVGVCYLSSELLAYHSSSSSAYVLAFRWREFFAQFFLAIWPWFIFRYTGIGPRWLVWGLSLYALLAIPPNLILPYGSLFEHMPVLTALNYPWGEQITFHENVPLTIYGYFPWAGILAAFIYTYYACYHQYQNGQHRQAIFLVCAATTFIVLTFENFLVETGLLDFIFLAHFGFLCLIVIMSITLHYQATQLIENSAAKYRTLFNTAGDAIFLMEDGHFVDCNASTLKIFGCQREDIVGSTPMAFSPPNQYDGNGSIEKAQEKINAAINGKPQYFDWLHQRLDGTLFDAEVSLNFIKMNGDTCLQAIVRDVSVHRRSEQALRTIALGVTGQSGDQFFNQMTRSLNKLFDAKYAFIGLLNESDPMQVDTLSVSMDGKIIDNMSYRLESTPCQNVVGQGTCTHPKGVQQLFPDDKLLQDMSVESYIGTPLINSKNEPIGLVVVLDIKPMYELSHATPVLEIFAARANAELERMKANQHIRHLAYKDYLTNLANRAALHEHLTSRLVLMRTSEISGALLVIDLDHFKTINDALSHDVGDDVLRLVGQRLHEIADGQAFMARIGGDEFAAVITSENHKPTTSLEKTVHRLAASISAALEMPMQLDERILNIGASIGVALFPQHGENELDILRHADMALHRAKNMGRGNIKFYEENLQKIVDERLQIEKGLRRAIELDELSLNFQPQTTIDGHMIGAEVLLRWNHPELGQVSPDRYIPVAEETGLIHAIGKWVLNEACLCLRTWQDNQIRFSGHLSVNVSAWQFANPEFVSLVTGILSVYNIKPHQVVLELTETALLYDIQETIDKLAQLQKHGIRIAIDDFGTGYSSLAYLKDMAMDILKIDKAFISELSRENEHPLVESIIAMGQHMNLEVIAEGVETEEQWNILRELGCETFQGYHVSHPLKETDFIKFLNKNNSMQ